VPTWKKHKPSNSANTKQSRRRFFVSFPMEVFAPGPKGILLTRECIFPLIPANLPYIQSHHYFSGSIEFTNQIKSVGCIKKCGGHENLFYLLALNRLAISLIVLRY